MTQKLIIEFLVKKIIINAWLSTVNIVIINRQSLGKHHQLCSICL